MKRLVLFAVWCTLWLAFDIWALLTSTGSPWSNCFGIAVQAICLCLALRWIRQRQGR